MKSKRKVFVSFVGSNDAGKLIGKDDGAILTALKAFKKVEKVYLLWSPTGNFKDIANYLKKEIINNRFCKNVLLHAFDLDNVTDHNEIYPKLLGFCKSNFKENEEVTAAIASGTPAMQVCWILMAESGDYKLKLIRSNESPDFQKSLSDLRMKTKT
jgi:sigma54-dependent transcription regulator